MEIKWCTAWEAKSLKFVEDLQEREDATELKQRLVLHILENEFLFSGERHAYGVGVPLFYENGRPIVRFVCDDWARFMYWVWEASLPRGVRVLDLRSDFHFPKNVVMKYPK